MFQSRDWSSHSRVTGVLLPFLMAVAILNDSLGEWQGDKWLAFVTWYSQSKDKWLVFVTW